MGIIQSNPSWSKDRYAVYDRNYDVKQVKKIIRLLEYAEQNYNQPMVIHVIGKITEDFKLTQIRDVLYTGLGAKNHSNETLTRLPFLYFATIEYKAAIGLHVHIMLIVDQCRFLPRTIRKKAIQALSKLQGIRPRKDGTPDIDDIPRREFDDRGRLVYMRGVNGQQVYTHFLKQGLKDAIQRYTYLAKVTQKKDVPMTRTFSSSQIPSYVKSSQQPSTSTASWQPWTETNVKSISPTITVDVANAA